MYNEFWGNIVNELQLNLDLLLINGIGYLVFLGILGIFASKHSFLHSVISIELLFYGVNVMFVLFGIMLQDIAGVIAALFILMFAGGESSLALALIMIYFNHYWNVSIPYVD